MWDDTTDPRLRDWLDEVHGRWRRTGVPVPARRQLGSALEQDLVEALAAGAAIDDLIAAEPGEFADQLAAAHGAAPESRAATPGQLAVTALGGAVAGAMAAWFFVWPLLFSRTETLSDGALVAIAYPVGAVTVLLGAVVALRVRFGGRPGLLGRVGPVLAGLVVGALLGLPATLAISGALDYPTQAAFVVIEAVPVLALGLVGAFLGPWLVAAAAAVRRGAPVSR